PVPVRLAERHYIDAVPAHRAALRTLEGRQHVKQRRLAGARWPGDAHEFACLGAEPAYVEHRTRPRRRPVPQPNVPGAEYRPHAQVLGVTRVFRRRAMRQAYGRRAVASTRRTWLTKPVAGSTFEPSSSTPHTSSGSEDDLRGTVVPFRRYTTAISCGQ